MVVWTEELVDGTIATPAAAEAAEAGVRERFIFEKLTKIEFFLFVIRGTWIFQSMALPRVHTVERGCSNNVSQGDTWPLVL